MNADEVLLEAGRRGIRLAARGDRVTYDAPRGSLSAALRSALTDHRAKILEKLRSGAERETDVMVARSTHTCWDQEKQRYWREWLWDLVYEGTVRQLLGAWADSQARVLLRQADPDWESLRDLVIRTRKIYWQERDREEKARHRVQDPHLR
jgi:hypothetical protein